MLDIDAAVFGELDQEPPPDDPWDDQPPPDEDPALVGEAPKKFVDVLWESLVDAADLDTISEPKPLIRDVLFVDSVAWIQGKRGHAKSLVGLDITGCVATGHHWQGAGVTTQGTVLFVVAEGVSGVKLRVRAWEKSMGQDMAGVRFLPVPVQAGLDQWFALVELVETLKPVLIVIDTQARVTVGMEENAAKDMGIFVDRLERLRRASGACVLVIHHMGRNGEHMRGSTALEGAATTILQVTKDDTEITITCEKQKDAAEFDDIHLKLVPFGDSVVLLPSSGGRGVEGTAAFGTAVKWWDIFRDERVSVSKLVRADVGAERTLYRHVRDLVDRGLAAPVEFGGHTFYRLNQDPNGVPE